MPVSITGYTLKQFFEDERLWTGHEAYEDVVFEFEGVPEGFADPLTIPDECRCQVFGGIYQPPHGPARSFEGLLRDWLDQLQHVRVTGILPRTAVLEFEQWLAQRGFDGVTIVPCRVG